MFIPFDNEMILESKKQSKLREPFINHHFELDHLSGDERNQIGFLGEFACCQLFGIDWKENIRENYLTIDEFDFSIKHLKVDVKTETVPHSFVSSIINGTVNDDKPWGRRLINKGQVPLLDKYDVIIFGLVDRENKNGWYPIGYITTKNILANYSTQKEMPFGVKDYRSPALAIRTSELKPLSLLRSTLQRHYQLKNFK
jgi:hypothetical protein